MDPIFKILTDILPKVDQGFVDIIQIQSDGKTLTITCSPTESYTIKFPPQNGAAGQYLQYDGESKLAWADPPASSGSSGTTLVSAYADYTGVNDESKPFLDVKTNQPIQIPASTITRAVIFTDGSVAASGGTFSVAVDTNTLSIDTANFVGYNSDQLLAPAPPYTVASTTGVTGTISTGENITGRVEILIWYN